MAEVRRTERTTTLNKENVLNKYRSYTYNFTLAVIRADQLNDPESYRNSDLDLIILKSGGKGSSGIAASDKLSQIQISNLEEEVLDKYSSQNNKRKTTETLQQNKGIVEGFNKNSPGRFDMFIDNVEISTLMGFSKQASTTIPTSISFEVFEPYSINGFIEAIHVAAIAGGYITYAQAAFVLKMEFRGYSDNQPVATSVAEKVQNSERYFVFRFTGLDIDVDQRGTRYRCKAVPFNEIGFGQANVIKKPVNASGTKVKDLLDNLMKNITDQMLESNKQSKEGPNANKSDIYEIKFPTIVDGVYNFDSVNDIGKSDIIEPNKENTLYKFVDNGTARADAYSPTPGKTTTPTKPSIVGVAPVVNFFNNATLSESIAAVIRDSTFLRKKLKDIKGNLDENDMFDYFLISIDVEDQKEIDEDSRTFFKKYTYIVTPYKIHYTKIPNYNAQIIDTSKIKKRVVREYNYIYTGKNIDVIDFKLNFNLLYFEAIPYALGNNKRPGSKDLLVSPRADNVKVTGDKIEKLQANEIPIPVKHIKSFNTVPDGGKASQLLDDPYSALAINLHEAVINSKVNLIQGEIQIIGDPLYLVTGSMAKFRPKLSSDVPTVTETGEVAHTVGEVLINITFNNPVDILPLNKGGILDFNKNKAPFSGVYKVLKVNSSFREGQFLQKLEIIRIPGQVDNNIGFTDPAEKIITKPNAEEISGENSANESQNTAQSPENSDNSKTIQSNLGTTNPDSPFANLGPGE